MNTTIVDQIRQDWLNGPAMVPPPGVTPNFVDPPNQRHIVLFVLIFYMTLSTIVILMRMYTKIFLLRKTVFEDCMSPFIAWFSDTNVHRRRRAGMGEGP